MYSELHSPGNRNDTVVLDIVRNELQRGQTLNYDDARQSTEYHLHFIWIAFNDDIFISGTNAAVAELLTLCIAL